MSQEQEKIQETFIVQTHKPDELQIDESLLQKHYNNKITTRHQTDQIHQTQNDNQQQLELFIDKNGNPLEFYIPDNEQQKDLLINIIIKHGGKISSDPNNGNYISSLAEVHREVIEPRFIFDSDTSGKQDIEKYKLLPPTGIYASTNKSQDVVQNDVQELVKYLDEGLAQAQADGDQHDQQALQNGLSRAVQTQPTQNIITTNHPPNQQENLNQESTQPQNKTGFTFQEDEIILEYVRRNPNRRSSHKLFQEIADKIGKHTGNSVRYRYRTFIAHKLDYVYKTDSNGNLIYDSEGKPIISSTLPTTLKTKYTAKDDYELTKAVRRELIERGVPFQRDPKDIILSGKFFSNLAETFPIHSQSSWRDRYRKFALPYGIDKYVDYYENELKEGRIPEAIKNFTGKFLISNSKKGKKDSTDIDEVVGETLSEHNDQFNKRQKKQQTKKGKSENDSKHHGTDSTNVFLAGGQDELSGISASNLFNSHAAAAVALANTQAETPDPDEFLTDDLVTAKFFEFRPLISVVDLITEIVSRNYQSSDAEALIDALYVEAGIEKKFGTFIVTAVCGDMVLIPKFIELFLKTGENPPQNVHGIWTPKDDQYLRSGDPDRLDYLKRLHGTKRIELRREFINQDLV